MKLAVLVVYGSLGLLEIGIGRSEDKEEKEKEYGPTESIGRYVVTRLIQCFVTSGVLQVSCATVAVSLNHVRSTDQKGLGQYPSGLCGVLPGLKDKNLDCLRAWIHHASLFFFFCFSRSLYSST